MGKYLRFLFGTPKFFKARFEPEEALHVAKQSLRDRVNQREDNLLQLIQKGIFGYSMSPYLHLLRPKKITFERIKRWVENEGVEATLRTLMNEGVYFTVDEFKGKSEVFRNGINLTVTEDDFDNPFVQTIYEVRSGATRSSGTRIRIDFPHLIQRSYYDVFLLNLHGCLNAPIANWFPIFPGGPGINSSLRFAYIGNPPQRWFSQVEKSRLKVNWEKRLGTNYIFFMSRLCGIPIARPEYVDLNHAHRVAEWAASTLEKHGRCVIYTFASSAVRVCIAAQESNLNLQGLRFFVTGEPLTPQKKNEITSVGAVAVPVYGISEAGVVASGCEKEHKESDHCHNYKDSISVIQHNYEVPHFGFTVDSYLFTTLLQASPKLLLNVGMGDYGILSVSSCECDFGKLGFDTQMSNIRSYEKLTGEGVTFVDTDFLRIIEHELPKRFGGRSTDYQLVEEEDMRGITHLKLFISPDLGELNEDNVATTLIELLRSSEYSPDSWAQSGSQMWTQARTIRVERQHPIPTKSSKILPFHIIKR